MSKPAIALRWLGAAGIEIAAQGRTLLIDPFFTRPPWYRLAGGRVGPDRALSARHAPRCDLCLITHAHYDHLMDAPEIVLRTGAPVYGSANACDLLVACGVPQGQVRGVVPGEEIGALPFRVRAVAGEHHRMPGYTLGPLRGHLAPPLRLRDYRLDDLYSYVIDVVGLRILHWSSKHTDGACPADVLLVYGIEPKALYEALLPVVRPRVIVPTHWDSLFRSLSAPLRPSLTLPLGAFPPLRRANMDRFRRWMAEIAPYATVLVPERLAEVDLGG